LAEGRDLRADLCRLKAQALGIQGLGDYGLDPHRADVAAAQTPHAQVKRLEGSRHLPMFGGSEQLNRTLPGSVMR
jgi:pimeloyl-ACP methyl ester carboxylesterase